VADLVKKHVLTLKEVIDAQASGSIVQAYTALLPAAGHMAMIADPLSDAIVKQFPAKYISSALGGLKLPTWRAFWDSRRASLVLPAGAPSRGWLSVVSMFY
jgi:hypothetical protein